MKIGKILDYTLLVEVILVLSTMFCIGLLIHKNNISNDSVHAKVRLVKSKYSYRTLSKIRARRAKRISGRNKFDRATNKWILRDINKERQKRNLKPLKWGLDNQRIADARNPLTYNAYLTVSNYRHYRNYNQTSNYTDNYIHGVDKGNDMMDIVRAMNLSSYGYNGYSENANEVYLGRRNVYIGALRAYKANTPKEVAYDTINSQVYHDRVDIKGLNNNNGHRKDILNPNYRHIGIASYNLPNHNGNLMSNVEEFD